MQCWLIEACRWGFHLVVFSIIISASIFQGADLLQCLVSGYLGEDDKQAGSLLKSGMFSCSLTRTPLACRLPGFPSILVNIVAPVKGERVWTQMFMTRYKHAGLNRFMKSSRASIAISFTIPEKTLQHNAESPSFNIPVITITMTIIGCRDILFLLCQKPQEKQFTETNNIHWIGL